LKALVKNLDVSMFPPEIRAKSEELTKKKEVLSKEVEKEDSDLANLESQINALSQDITSLKRSAEDQADGRDAQERKLKREKQELENLDKKLQEIVTDKKEAQITLEKLKKEAGNVQNDSSSSTLSPDDEDDGSYEVIPWEDLSIRSSYGKIGTAEVSIASRTGEKLFVKKLPSKRAFDEQIRYVAQLHSGYVLQMFGANVRQRFIALEYLPMNLNKLSLDTTQEISWEKKWGIARDILLGLLYLHSRNPPILKGKEAGLRPYNIFVGSDWATKIALPGVLPSCCEDEEEFWLAPEVASGSEAFSVQSDVFSYGLILWQLATRQRPFAGLNASKVGLPLPLSLPLPLPIPPHLPLPLLLSRLFCFSR
jgi:regulator of replication initiation timing